MERGMRGRNLLPSTFYLLLFTFYLIQYNKYVMHPASLFSIIKDYVPFVLKISVFLQPCLNYSPKTKIMKKLFTFLMAMIVVAACFAQNGNKYEVVGVPADQNMDRSNWYGWYAQSGYVHTQVAESEYFLFIPAGTFTTQVQLEKVRFYTIPSENITNYTGSPFTLDNDFVIRIYTGAAIEGLDFNPGTLAYSQSYNPSVAGADAGA